MKLSENAEQVVNSRYSSKDEGWELATHRVASNVARNDNGYKDPFQEAIYEMLFLPAGRILRNAGRPGGSMFNCFVLPVLDSIESIGQLIKDSLILWSDGGGTGTNYSLLRPKDAPIKGKGGKSSGMVSFIKAVNAVAKTVESGGGRRAASLALAQVSHPEIMDFINCKMVDGELDRFNVSVGITTEFLESVIDDGMWEYTFNKQPYGSVKARTVWDKILTNMIKYAEPGLINWSNLVKNNSYYYAPISSTNPCGEAPLEQNGACDLGSIVLPNHCMQTRTNWAKMENTVRLAVRFLDDVIDVNNYSIPEIKSNAFNSRRIGIGVMGLAEYLFSKHIRYGSAQSIVETERVMKFIRDVSYDESVKLAVEKGAFPAFQSSPYCKASFIRKLPAKLRMSIREHGIRNVSLLAVAPTGTISLLPEVTGGIEPLFAKAYRRADRVSERVYINPMYKEVLTSGDVPEWFVDAYDLQPEDHLEIQAACQKYVDGAVSKTINLPKGFKKEQLDKLLLEYLFSLKGVTVYRDGTRKDQILNRISEKEARKHLEVAEGSLTEDDVQCVGGTCEI